MRFLLDLVAPLTCAACGRPGDDLCPACADHLEVLREPVAADAHSLVSYAGPARALTLRLKRTGSASLARAMGGLLADLVAVRELPVEVVTSVPGSRRAGFDHVAAIAREVARGVGLPLQRLVRRTGGGPRQADVDLSRRWSNVAGRFAASGRPPAGGVLLVDDVYTTGATSRACAEALRAAGATSVTVLTWARTPRLGAPGPILGR